MVEISDSDLLLEELLPFLLAPRARDLVRHETVPEHGRRNVDAVLPRELDCGVCAVHSATAPGHLARYVLVYFKSSVTAFPPFGVDLSARWSWNAATLSCPIESPTSLASFSRIWSGVRVDVGMSKYSPCALKSASENFQKSWGATRDTYAARSVTRPFHISASAPSSYVKSKVQYRVAPKGGVASLNDV